MCAAHEWDDYIGPEVPTSHQGRPYIDTGGTVSAHWPTMHRWCQSRIALYSWNGSRFNFEYLDDLLWFCNTWMIEDQIEETLEEF